MLKLKTHKLAMIAAGALMVMASPASALSASAEAAFEAEIGEAKSKMMAHSSTALEHARKARKLVAGENAKAKKAQLTAQWLEAEALVRLNRAGEAAPIIDKAVAETAAQFEGTRLHADLLRSQGNLHKRSGAFLKALSAYEEAQEIYSKIGEARSHAIVLLGIGSLYSGSRDYEKALEYYQKGLEAFPQDPALGLSAHNNMGNALKGLARYTEAETAFAKALEAAKAKSSPLLEARILTNIASAQALSGKLDDAQTTAERAMKLAKEHAEGWERFVHGVFAQIELRQGNLGEAKGHLDQVFEGEDLGSTAPHFREFHELAAQVFYQNGQTAEAQLHSSAISRLDAGVSKLASM